MLLPNGQPANNIERVMLLSMWTKSLKHNAGMLDVVIEKEIISAGMGKPTYPINKHTVASYLAYWKNIEKITDDWRSEPNKLHEGSAVDYGDPGGDEKPLKIMSQVMSDWYGIKISQNNILFTVGGIGGLRIIFETFNTHFDDAFRYRVITPCPYYSAYANNPSHLLHPIPVMDEPGYRLSAKALDKSIQESYEMAEQDHIPPKMVLICNPSNPLGSVINDDEAYEIADVLRKYPELYIVIDEAYIEMNYVKCHSLLSIAPDLKQRMIVLRSATKSLSAAGERMAILIAFDEALMKEMVNKCIGYFIHAPRSAQLAYAETMTKFDASMQKEMADFYKVKVDYIVSRLEKMGASMPDPYYRVEATFYVIGDFSDLFGLQMPAEVEKVFERSDIVSSNEELAYYLLFKEGIMLAPMSYFGLSADCGFLRITCSAHQSELTELMDRLESCLLSARKTKHTKLSETVQRGLEKLRKVDSDIHLALSAKIGSFIQEGISCKEFRLKNQQLQKSNKIISNFLQILDLEMDEK